jgi:hypothetical protein
MSTTATISLKSRHLIDFCRTLTLDGDISDEDAWELGNYLNENPELCDEWPGNELLTLISKIFEYSSVSEFALKQLASKISLIENEFKIYNNEQISKLIESSQKYDCILPSINKIVAIKSYSNPDESYSVNLLDSSCSCSDWYSQRRHFPPNSLNRCCKHIAYALHKNKKDFAYPEWLKNLIDECINSKRGLNPKSKWAIIIIKNSPIIVSSGNSDWINVYVNSDGHFSKFEYNIKEQVWSYGMRPYYFATIKTALGIK